MDRRAWQATVHEVTKSGQDWVTNTFTSLSNTLKQKSLTGGMKGDVGLDHYIVWLLAMCLLEPSLKWMPWLSKHKSGTCITRRKFNSLGLPYNTINAQPSTTWVVRQRGRAFRWWAGRTKAIKTNITFSLAFVGRFLKGIDQYKLGEWQDSCFLKSEKIYSHLFNKIWRLKRWLKVILCFWRGKIEQKLVKFKFWIKDHLENRKN